MKKTKILTVVVMVISILALVFPMTAAADVAANGQVTSIWLGAQWPPVISGWTWAPPAGNFGFRMTSDQEKWIHTGDEYQYYTSDPAMIEPNSISWVKYAYDHGGGKTLPFSYKFTWAPLMHPKDPNTVYTAYAQVTPQIAQLLAANGLTLAQLQSGNPIDSTPAPTPAATKVTTATSTSSPAPAKVAVATTPATPSVSTSTQKVAATLPTPPAKGDLSAINNPDSQTSKDIQTYDANAVKVKAQAAAQAKAAAQQKKVRTYELWVIAGLAVLLVVLLGIGWVRRRKVE